jgi:hypothetical protein
MILLKMLQLEENKRCDFIELNKILEEYDNWIFYNAIKAISNYFYLL